MPSSETRPASGAALRCLIAVPYQSYRPEIWPETARNLASRLPSANPGWEFDQAIFDAQESRQPGDSKFAPHARARNAVIDRYLLAPDAPAYDYVLFADSDLVDYPADLPSIGHECNPEGITAPCVVVATKIWRFYDTAGFVTVAGQHLRHENGWFPEGTERRAIQEMKSVGCCLLCPADLLRNGTRFRDPEDGHNVEIAPVCWDAKAAGRSVVCLTTRVAIHAYLPDHGEAWH